jgi:hypothetical protein
VVGGGNTTMSRHLRTTATGLTALAALLTLTSCSLLGPDPEPSPVATTVVDPSMVVPSPTAAPTDAPADPTPPATDAPTAAPTSSATPTAVKRAVTPFITSALWDDEGDLVDVEAVIPNIVEDAGTCTLVARKGTTVRMVSQPAAPAASTTTCNPLQIQGDQLSAGTWTVTISYASARSAGVSASRTVAVTK